ncbi:hypothetical protein C8K44_1224 [Aminobacter sp. AP02]|nr:hypothetical protein C8K44_1224 [Aminobacter sp. AP02]
MQLICVSLLPPGMENNDIERPRRPSSPAGPSPRNNGEKEDGRNADAPLSPSFTGRG